MAGVSRLCQCSRPVHSKLTANLLVIIVVKTGIAVTGSGTSKAVYKQG